MLNKILLWLNLILAISLIICVIVIVIMGNVIGGGVKKEYKFSDFDKEIKNNMVLEKKEKYFIEKLEMIKTENDKIKFKQEYKSYFFDPTFFDKKANYENMPVVILNFPDRSSDLTKDFILLDFFIFRLYNQIMFRTNYLDYRSKK